MPKNAEVNSKAKDEVLDQEGSKETMENRGKEAVDKLIKGVLSRGESIWKGAKKFIAKGKSFFEKGLYIAVGAGIVGAETAARRGSEAKTAVENKVKSGREYVSGKANEIRSGAVEKYNNVINRGKEAWAGLVNKINAAKDAYHNKKIEKQLAILESKKTEIGGGIEDVDKKIQESIRQRNQLVEQQTRIEEMQEELKAKLRNKAESKTETEAETEAVAA